MGSGTIPLSYVSVDPHEAASIGVGIGKCLPATIVFTVDGSIELLSIGYNDSHNALVGKAYGFSHEAKCPS